MLPDKKSIPTVKTPDARGRQVLLVEDNEINRLVAREMLLGFGCIVTEAFDGLDGIEYASRKRFDLILMDISMPRLDGVSAARQIRKGTGPNGGTPIVALTAHTLPEDIRQFRQTGFSDVLIKPLSRGRLAEVLSGSFGGHDSLDRGLDMERELVEVLGGEAASQVRSKAIAEIFSSLEKMDRGLRGGTDTEAVLEDVHKMMGLSALVGLTETHSCLLALNKALKEPEGSGIRELVAAVRSSLEAVRAAA